MERVDSEDEAVQPLTMLIQEVLEPPRTRICGRQWRDELESAVEGHEDRLGRPRGIGIAKSFEFDTEQTARFRRIAFDVLGLDHPRHMIDSIARTCHVSPPVPVRIPVLILTS